MKNLILILIITLTSYNVFGQIQPDKILHFKAGVITGIFTNVLIQSITKDKKKAFWWGAGMSAFVGLLKEAMDEEEYKGWSNSDLGATVLGGMFGSGSVSFTINIFDGKKRKKQFKNGN